MVGLVGQSDVLGIYKMLPSVLLKWVMDEILKVGEYYEENCH